MKIPLNWLKNTKLYSKTSILTYINWKKTWSNMFKLQALMTPNVLNVKPNFLILSIGANGILIPTLLDAETVSRRNQNNKESITITFKTVFYWQVLLRELLWKVLGITYNQKVFKKFNALMDLVVMDVVNAQQLLVKLVTFLWDVDQIQTIGVII